MNIHSTLRGPDFATIDSVGRRTYLVTWVVDGAIDSRSFSSLPRAMAFYGLAAGFVMKCGRVRAPALPSPP
jgi:hypothetical protein